MRCSVALNAREAVNDTIFALRVRRQRYAASLKLRFLRLHGIDSVSLPKCPHHLHLGNLYRKSKQLYKNVVNCDVDLIKGGLSCERDRATMFSGMLVIADGLGKSHDMQVGIV
jgi:hypothetical protein